jgi:transcriptional regulator with XRE-family HTH domain
MTTSETVSAKVALLIHLRGWTQQDVADMIGVQQASVSRKLLNKQRWWVDEVYAIADAGGVDPAYLTSTDGLPRLDSNQQPAGYRVHPFGAYHQAAA